jgi:hypothetical protein
VSGIKFDDLNESGQPDGDPVEPGIEDWEIRAYRDNGDGILLGTEASASPAATMLTDESGAYRIELDPGKYVLCEAGRAGWEQTAPGGQACDAVTGVAPGGFALDLGDGVEIPGHDFGNKADDTWVTTEEDRWCRELTLWRDLAA